MAQLLLKYIDTNEEVHVIPVTAKVIQKFLDDYFDFAQRMANHSERDLEKLGDKPTPSQIALYNSLTEGMWNFNGPLRSIAQINQLFIDQGKISKAKAEEKSIKDILKESEQ